MNERQIYHMKATANMVLYHVLAMKLHMDSLASLDAENFKDTSVSVIVDEFRDLENYMGQIRDVVGDMLPKFQELATPGEGSAEPTIEEGGHVRH